MKRTTFIFGGIAGAIGLLLIGLGQRLQPKPVNYCYDPRLDEYTVEGLIYSGQFFREFGRLMPEGQAFRVVERREGSAGKKKVWIERMPG